MKHRVRPSGGIRLIPPVSTVWPRIDEKLQIGFLYCTKNVNFKKMMGFSS